MTSTRIPESTKLQPQTRSGLLIAAGVLIGMGLAGFFDGIILHQVLQWHHMVTSIRPGDSLANLEANTFWDGVFHIGAYFLTFTGLILLWRAYQNPNAPRSAKPLIGSILIGAGSFDFIEGLVDHQILGIHHVKYGSNQFAWDMGFLALGLILAIAGWIILTYQTDHKTV
jgi:uncharacterized membrane protein